MASSPAPAAPKYKTSSNYNTAPPRRGEVKLRMVKSFFSNNKPDFYIPIKMVSSPAAPKHRTGSVYNTARRTGQLKIRVVKSLYKSAIGMLVGSRVRKTYVRPASLTSTTLVGSPSV